MELLGTISEAFNEYRATHNKAVGFSRMFVCDGVKSVHNNVVKDKIWSNPLQRNVLIEFNG
jgi:hypothetical protein